MKQFKDYIVEYEIHHDGHGNYRDDEGNEWTSKTGGAHRSSFGRRHTITSYQPDHPHSVHINGKKWKTFGSASHATNVARKIKGATVHREEVELDENWLVHKDGKILKSGIKQYKTAKAHAEKHGAQVNSAEWYHDNVSSKNKSVKEDMEQIDELSDTTLMNYAQKVHDDSLKHDKDPSKRSATKRNKSVMGFSRAINKLESRPHKESTDMCNVCGQTPCNCTHIEEELSDPVRNAKQNKDIATGKKPMPKSKLPSFKETVELDELSTELLQRYKDKAKQSADELSAQGKHKKAADRWLSHMKATGKQIDKTTANIKKALSK